MYKIAFVANTSFNLYNFRLPLMEALSQKGYKVIGIAPKDEYSKLLTDKGFKFIPLQRLNNKSKNPFEDFKFFLELLSIFKMEKPTAAVFVTIKPNIYGGLVSSFLKIPYINFVTGLGSAFIKKNITTYIAKNLYRLAFLSSKKVVFQNQDDLNFFVKSKIVSQSKAVVIPGSGVDLKKFNPGFCKKFRQSKQKFIFLYIGRLIYEKGIGELIEAGKALYAVNKNFEIHLLGKIDQNNPSAVKQETFKKWLKLPFIKYLGFHKDVRGFICRSDFVVLPSYREGLPRSLLEAMALGKPIITTNVPGCNELVFNNLNGFLADPKDIRSLYSTMLKAIKLPQKNLNLMGFYSYKLVKASYSIDIVLPKYIEIIEEILKKSK